LKKVKEQFTDNSDMVWTGCETAKEVRDELDGYIEQLSKGYTGCLKNLNLHFAPTSTFQEHSLQNGWAKEYLQLSKEFDSIYKSIKNDS
jgi:hypothetical protein